MDIKTMDRSVLSLNSSQKGLWLDNTNPTTQRLLARDVQIFKILPNILFDSQKVSEFKFFKYSNLLNNSSTTMIRRFQ